MCDDNKCPYCTSENGAIREIFFDQTCRGCVARMTEEPEDMIQSLERQLERSTENG